MFFLPAMPFKEREMANEWSVESAASGKWGAVSEIAFSAPPYLEDVYKSLVAGDALARSRGLHYMRTCAKEWKARAASDKRAPSRT